MPLPLRNADTGSMSSSWSAEQWTVKPPTQRRGGRSSVRARREPPEHGHCAHRDLLCTRWPALGRCGRCDVWLCQNGSVTHLLIDVTWEGEGAASWATDRDALEGGRAPPPPLQGGQPMPSHSP